MQTSDWRLLQVKNLPYYHGFLPRQDAEDMVIKVHLVFFAFMSQMYSGFR